MSFDLNQVSIVNPRRGVMEKMILSKFVDRTERGMLFLSIEEAVESCRFSLHQSTQKNDSSSTTSNM